MLVTIVLLRSACSRGIFYLNILSDGAEVVLRSSGAVLEGFMIVMRLRVEDIVEMWLATLLETFGALFVVEGWMFCSEGSMVVFRVEALLSLLFES